ncbi:hypothetical protein BCR34DRAFT_605121 [Clohesyomyces aquaticus]|uniref:Uncharacterized protein n=1 Tax=Clohesyomyces aquaticus TaxID=1231657 RepID=A0A1Y1Z1M9_9PLEO|nr:hypothetical protein BCR34DRAFT_605121 [Clohesyomyces aquaticus]
MSPEKPPTPARTPHPKDISEDDFPENREMNLTKTIPKASKDDADELIASNLASTFGVPDRFQISTNESTTLNSSLGLGETGSSVTTTGSKRHINPSSDFSDKKPRNNGDHTLSSKGSMPNLEKEAAKSSLQHYIDRMRTNNPGNQANNPQAREVLDTGKSVPLEVDNASIPSDEENPGEKEPDLKSVYQPITDIVQPVSCDYFYPRLIVMASVLDWAADHRIPLGPEMTASAHGAILTKSRPVVLLHIYPTTAVGYALQSRNNRGTKDLPLEQKEQCRDVRHPGDMTSFDSEHEPLWVTRWDRPVPLRLNTFLNFAEPVSIRLNRLVQPIGHLRYESLLEVDRIEARFRARTRFEMEKNASKYRKVDENETARLFSRFPQLISNVVDEEEQKKREVRKARFGTHSSLDPNASALRTESRAHPGKSAGSSLQGSAVRRSFRSSTNDTRDPYPNPSEARYDSSSGNIYNNRKIVSYDDLDTGYQSRPEEKGTSRARDDNPRSSNEGRRNEHTKLSSSRTFEKPKAGSSGI